MYYVMPIRYHHLNLAKHGIDLLEVEEALYDGWRQRRRDGSEVKKMNRESTNGITIFDQDKELPPRRLKQEILTIRISSETLTWLREVAAEKEIGPSTLARIWILERLGQERPPGDSEWR
jgi:hypothetical protein